jgi:ribonuclease Z
MTENNTKEKTSICWRGKHLKVDILYSEAGVAQQVLVSSKKGSILVDAGDGVLRDLWSRAFTWERLKGIIITHGHFDHIGGLYSLLGFMRMIGRKGLLKIAAPENCEEVRCLVDCYLRKYSTTSPYQFAVEYLKPGQTVDIAGMIIKAHKAVHCGSIKTIGITSQLPALSYRLTAGGEIVALSGDTGKSAPLKELVKDADLAILEATYEKSSDVSSEYLENVHLSEDIAHEIGKLAKEYILIHKAKRQR